MERFTVTAVPATNPQVSQQPPSSTWLQHQSQQQQQLRQHQSQQHQSQHQSQHQLPHVSDDSAHDPRGVGSGRGQEEEDVLALRPELGALRGRDDSARDMPVTV